MTSPVRKVGGMNGSDHGVGEAETDWHTPSARAIWCPEHGTPRADGWRREAYEAIIPRFWPKLTGLLGPLPDSGTYDINDAVAAVPGALNMLIRETTEAEGIQFLAAMDYPIAETADLLAANREQPRGKRQLEPMKLIKESSLEAFWHVVSLHSKLLMVAPNDYDRMLGAPPADISKAGPGVPFMGMPNDGPHSLFGARQLEKLRKNPWTG